MFGCIRVETHFVHLHSILNSHDWHVLIAHSSNPRAARELLSVPPITHVL